MKKQVIKFGGTCLGNKNKYKWIANEIKNSKSYDKKYNYYKNIILEIVIWNSSM